MSAQSIEGVVVEELAQVEASRALRLDANGSRPPANNSLIGLAFSGGGIRSATFNLGVLEAFAQKRLLRVFDYLSTVSGGGYIGGWLMAWMHYAGQGIRQIEEQLAPHPYSLTKPADPPSVRFLRSYSNYLTPRKGILGGDFWAFVASYLRNMLLNQFILLLLPLEWAFDYQKIRGTGLGEMWDSYSRDGNQRMPHCWFATLAYRDAFGNRQIGSRREKAPAVKPDFQQQAREIVC